GWTRFLFSAGVPADRLNLVEITGDAMTPDNVLARIKALPVQPDEGLVFLYFGHGAFLADGRHVFGLFGPGERPAVLPRQDVMAALQAKKAGLTVLLSDCCSNVLDAGPATRPAPLRAEAARDLHAPLRCLFFQHRGVVDITAAEKGTSAW